MMQRIAVLGGTFNPVHYGHLLLAEAARTQLHLDRILWVPSYHPPHRHDPTLVLFLHRVAMLKLAIADHPDFILSTVESEQPGKSFAIHTLTALKQQHPDSEWIWIVGMDAFQSLPKWYRGAELAANCQWAIAPRASALVPESQHSPRTLCQQITDQIHTHWGIDLVWHLLDMPRIDISSSLIRGYCGDRRSIRYLVPEAVRHYIEHQRLYGR